MLRILSFILLLSHSTTMAHSSHAPRELKLASPWLSPFDLPPTQQQQQRPLPEDELQAHGTTTLAFTFSGGLILAVDSRASIGKYVGSRTTRKVFPMSRHVVATMAGGAADCTYWIRLCTRLSKLHEYSSGAPLPVASLATLLSKKLREMRHAKLSVGTMVAGWDQNTNSSCLYYVDSEGSCISGKSFCVGSGANVAYSILDAENLQQMGVDEAVDLATWAIWHATNRDGFSGGWVNVFHINATGIHHLVRTDSRRKPRKIDSLE